MSDDSATRPFISVVMPAYNRRTLIGRAIDSCLRQDFADFEIVVVDDASTDGTPDFVRAIQDPRIRLIEMERNQGPGEARNRGMEASRGEWLLFFDSDDELVPGGLARIAQRAREAEPDVGMIRFMVRNDKGQLSPDPPHELERWDRIGYLRWMERSHRRLSEAISAVRAATYPDCRYPPGFTHESTYNLDVAQRWGVRTYPDVVRLYHSDADEQITKVSISQMHRFAVAWGDNVDDMMRRHGDEMRRHAPNIYAQMQLEGAMAHMMKGRRLRGLGYGLRFLRLRPTALSGYAVLAVGMLGPDALARFRTAKDRVRARRASSADRAVQGVATQPGAAQESGR